MATLWNRKTLKQEEVADERISDALVSGLYSYEKGQQVNFITPSGKAVTIPSENALKALGKGYRIEQTEQTIERENRAKYGEGILNKLSAAGHGAVETILPGVQTRLETPDIVKKIVWNEEKQKAEIKYMPQTPIEMEIATDQRRAQIEMLRKYNPGAYAAGGIAAAVSGVGLPGIAAKAGKVVAGKVAKSLAAKAIEKGIKGTVAKALPAIAGEAVEGAFYGAGIEISESALGDRDLAVENLLGSAGMGLVLGGAASGALKVAGAGSRAITGKVKDTMKPVASAIETLYERATGRKPAEGVGNLYAKVSGVASGAGDDVSTFFGKGGKEARKLAAQPASHIDEIGIKAFKEFDELLQESDPVLREVMGSAKIKNIGKKIKTGNEEQVKDSAISMLDNLTAKLDEMKAAGEGQYEQYNLRQLQKMIGHQKKEFIKAANASDPAINQKAFGILDGVKRQIGKQADRLNDQLTSKSSKLTTEPTYSAYNKIYHDLRGHLELDDLYGEAAIAQRNINKNFTEHLSDNNFRRGQQFWAKKGSMAAETGEGTFASRYRANDKKFLEYFKGLNSKEGLEREYINNWVQTRRNLIESIGKEFELSAAQTARVAKTKELANRSLKTLEQGEKEVILMNQLKEMASIPAINPWITTLAGGAVGGVAGYAATGDVYGGVAGAGLVSGGLGLLSQPALVVRQLAAMERISAGVGAKTQKQIKEYFTGMGSKIAETTKRAKRRTEQVAKISRRAVVPLAVQSRNTKEYRKERNEKFKKRVDKLSEIVSSPESVTMATSSIAEAAPQVALGMQEKAISAAQFLLNKAPKPPAPAGIASRDKWKPSDQDLAKFERYERIVNDPMNILNDIQKGRLNAESVEALKTVYPKMYENILNTIRDNLLEFKQTMPYDDRVQLSILFGVPVDEVTKPDFIAMMQSNYVEEQQEQEQQQQQRQAKSASAKPGVFKTLTEKSYTASQRLEAR